MRSPVVVAKVQHRHVERRVRHASHVDLCLILLLLLLLLLTLPGLLLDGVRLRLGLRLGLAWDGLNWSRHVHVLRSGTGEEGLVAAHVLKEGLEGGMAKERAGEVLQLVVLFQEFPVEELQVVRFAGLGVEIPFELGDVFYVLLDRILLGL